MLKFSYAKKTFCLKEFSQGVLAAFPLIISYNFIGFASGSLGSFMGLSVVEVALLSLIVYAGSAQFVFALLYTTPSFILVSTIFLLNFRHFLYAVSFLPLIKNLPLGKKIAIGFQLTDETFALTNVLKKEPFQKAHWMLGLHLASHSAWLTGNTLGAVWGKSNFISSFSGLKFALAAMFASILILQWISSKNKLATSIAIICSALIFIFLDIFFKTPLNLLISIFCSCSIGVFFSKEEAE